MAEVEALPRPGDAHIGQPALLLELHGVTQGPEVGEHPVLHADDEHHRVLEPLGGVQGHEDHLAVGPVRSRLPVVRRGGIVHVGEVVGVGHQADLFEEVAHVLEPGCHTDQLGEVLKPPVGLDRMLGTQPVEVSGAAQRRLQDRRGPVVDPSHQGLVEVQERLDTRGRPSRHTGLATTAQRLHEPAPRLFGQSVDPADGRVADTPLRDVEHPFGCDLVDGVCRNPQVGNGVAHLTPLVEAGTAHHTVRNPEPHQLLLHRTALRVRAVEDGQVRPPVPATVVQGGKPLHHPPGLVDLVGRPVALDRLTLADVGPKILGLATRVPRDHGIGRIQDRLGGAVVLVQDHHRGIREHPLELQDVPDVGTPEPVDRLVAVADDAQVPVFLGKHHHQVVLDGVGVLVLVDQDVLEPTAVFVEHVGVAAEESHRIAEQVVEVHCPCPLQPRLVLEEHLADPLLEGAGGPVRVCGRPQTLVLGRRDRGVDRAGREPLGVQVQVAHDVAGEAYGVALVVDAEPGREAYAFGIPSQDPHTRRVERRHPHPLGYGADQVGHTLLHLGGRLVREGDGQDSEGRHAPLGDQVGDAPGEDPGLAGPRTGDHQQRSRRMGDRIQLRRIEVWHLASHRSRAAVSGVWVERGHLRHPTAAGSRAFECLPTIE